jgi:hypothetical protein
VRAVTEAGSGGVFAAAEIDGFGLGGIELHGAKVSGFVAAVAEGLTGAQSAGTPEVTFAGFNLDGVGTFLSDDWFGHVAPRGEVMEALSPTGRDWSAGQALTAVMNET